MAKKKKKKGFRKNWWKYLIILVILTLGILAYLFLDLIVGFFSGLILSPPPWFPGPGGSSGGDGTTLSCEDSDSGLNYYLPGHTTDQDNTRSYDNCESDTLLTEFYCAGSLVKEKVVACPLGYTCEQTRSGGYCEMPSSNNDGDLLGSGSDSGATDSPYESFEIDMGEIGSGNCEIGATFSTSWDYGNQECVGLQGAEGIIWTVYDSNGKVYTRTDLAPISLGNDLGCGLIYDGQTPFLVTMQKTAGLPNCVIEYEWELRLVACNCQ